MMTERNKNFYQGFAAVLGSLIREHGNSSMAIAIMRNHGVNLNELKQADVDDFDMVPIRKAWKEETL